MEGQMALARNTARRRRMWIGLALGAGSALLLSTVVNQVFMIGQDMTVGELTSRILRGSALRGNMAELLPPRFFQALQGHGHGLQGVFLLIFMALILYPCLFSYFGGRFGLRTLGYLVLGYLLLSLSAVLPQLSVSAGLIAVVAALGATWSARRNDDDFFGLAVCCGSMMAAIPASFGLLSLLSGRDVFSLFSVTLTGMLGDLLSRMSQVTLHQDAFLPYFTPVEGQILFRDLFLYAFACAALLVGVLNFLLSAKGAKGDGALSYRAASFRVWRLPNSFVIGMLLLCLFGELGKRFGWPSFDAVTGCFFLIFAFALAVQGLSTLVFMGLEMRSFWPLLIAVLISLRSGLGTFAFVGLFEQLFNMRTRLQIMTLASYLASQDRRRGQRNGRGDEEDVGEMLGRMEEMDPKELESLQQAIRRQEQLEKERRDDEQRREQEWRDAQERDDDDKK